jgi:hypothetical protein
LVVEPPEASAQPLTYRLIAGEQENRVCTRGHASVGVAEVAVKLRHEDDGAKERRQKRTLVGNDDDDGDVGH